MFKIGEVIIYSGHGLCRIDDICEKTILGETKKYYVLQPIDNHQLTISIPVDNEKVVMLGLVEKEEAQQIVDSFDQTGFEWETNANTCYQTFRNIINSGNRSEIAKVVNTLLRKKIEAKQNDKKLYERDLKLLTETQSILYKELALALDKTVEEIEQTINESIRKECM